MNKLIGSLMMIGISGETLTSDEKEFIVENDIAGVTLFSRNCKTPEQIYNLCAEIQSLSSRTASKAPRFVAIDMEGGRVHRLPKPFTQWPAPKFLGQIDNATLTFQFSNMMGAELAAVGINLNFAPCLDILSNPENTAIGDRSLGADPELVARNGSALVRGYIKSNILSCIKHFPGHGNTMVDSHFELPKEDSITLERLESFELIPFKRAAKARCDMVMPGHLFFPKIDPDFPVSFSKIFIQDLLRNSMRFRGIVVTDDLDMKALTKYYSIGEIPVKALQAGADLLLYCNVPESSAVGLEGVIEAVAQGSLDKADLEEKSRRILSLKREKLGAIEVPSWEQAKEVIGLTEHLDVAQSVIDRCRL